MIDLSEIAETRIVKSERESTETLNVYLREGWVLLQTYTMDAGDSVPSQFPCFVIGWPKGNGDK